MSIMQQWAGHFRAGGSDKVWAAAYETDGQFLSVWGRRGNALQSSAKQCANQDAAAREFNKKVKAKIGEGYQSVPFDDQRYGIPAFGVSGEGGQTHSPELAALETSRLQPVYLASHVTPLTWVELQNCLQQEDFGATEKINGVRCLIACTEQGVVTAYNRKGVAIAHAPFAAQALKRLGCQFLIDGEQLQGEVGGDYVAFDLLEWQGQDVRAFPYRKRIRTLEEGMKRAGLIRAGAPTYAEALERSLIPELTLLTPAEPGLQIIETILAQKGEGIIVRTLDAPYEGGNTRYIRKFKFLADLDAIVIGIHPGKGTGSVQLGLVRPADSAIIDIGSVRSGLNDQAISRLTEMIKQGEYPVLTVRYLPIRTVNIALVEPKTSIKSLRTDKTAKECTTDQLIEQLGPEKAALIAAAPAMDSSAL